MYKPFPYQDKAIDVIVNFCNGKSNKKGLFVLPVAAGKSIIIANVVSRLEDKYVINIVPNKELLEQNYEKYTSYGYKASVCSASLGKSELGSVVYATIGSLKKHIDFFRDKDVVIIIDEAQRNSLKDSILHKFITEIKKCKTIGLTASPIRLHKGRLKLMSRMQDCFFTSIEYVMQIDEIIALDRWTPLKYEVEDLDTSMLQLNSTGNDYTKESLLNFSELNSLEDRVIASAKDLYKRDIESILVFCVNIKQAQSISEHIESSAVLHSKLNKKERTRIVNDFKSGKIKCVLNIGILTEGFDFPALQSIILARPTNSFGLYSQILGRGVRKFEGKEFATVVDFSGNFNKFGRIEDITYENNDYNRGWECWSGNNRLTNYDLAEGTSPKRSQDIARYKHLERRKKQIALNKAQGYLIPFGKYQNEPIKKVALTDPSYLKWTLTEARWSFDTKNMISYRDNVIKELGLSAIFDKTILVLADRDFDVYSLYVNKINHLLSDTSKNFVVLDGIDRRNDDILKTFLSASKDFLGIDESKIGDSKIDGVIAFSNGSCARTRDRLSRLKDKVERIQIVEY